MYVANGSTSACPVKMLQKYVMLADINLLSSEFIFKRVFSSHGIAKLIYKNKKISYTTARENIISRLKEVSSCLNLGLHSLRLGFQIFFYLIVFYFCFFFRPFITSSMKGSNIC